MAEFLDSVVVNRPSQIWRAVSEGKEVLKQGLIRRIGNGKETEVWSCNWLPRHGMMRPYGCLTANPPHLVCELINQTMASWRRDVIDETFLPMDKSVIMSIPLFTCDMEDKWAWTHEKSGNFMVRSRYRMLVAT